MCFYSIDTYLVFIGHFFVSSSFYKTLIENVMRLWRKLLYVFHNLFDFLFLPDCLHYRVGIYVG